ncbi:hypothetical protein GJ496_004943 [Pomphorhynchus laevis]|nr:hypothetical protein GJ496_004943 [Pomphorhynchus laevis]
MTGDYDYHDNHRLSCLTDNNDLITAISLLVVCFHRPHHGIVKKLTELFSVRWIYVPQRRSLCRHCAAVLAPRNGASTAAQQKNLQLDYNLIECVDPLFVISFSLQKFDDNNSNAVH